LASFDHRTWNSTPEAAFNAEDKTASEIAMAPLYERSHLPVRRSEVPWALGVGAAGGIIAGIVFAAFEMLAAAALMGADAFFMPLRMIGAILIGPAALDPGYPLLSAALAGVAVHVVLAVLYGMIFAVITGGLRSATTDILLGAAYGFALWLFNFYVVAPAAFPWFLDSPPVLQLIGHSVFFGAVLGWYVWNRRQHAQTTAA
jgi:hypothetical protein